MIIPVHVVSGVGSTTDQCNGKYIYNQVHSKEHDLTTEMTAEPWSVLLITASGILLAPWGIGLHQPVGRRRITPLGLESWKNALEH